MYDFTALITALMIHRTESGSAIDFRYKGIIKMPPEVQKLFSGDPTMATVPFGYTSKLLPSLASRRRRLASYTNFFRPGTVIFSS